MFRVQDERGVKRKGTWFKKRIEGSHCDDCRLHLLHKTWWVHCTLVWTVRLNACSQYMLYQLGSSNLKSGWSSCRGEY